MSFWLAYGLSSACALEKLCRSAWLKARGPSPRPARLGRMPRFAIGSKPARAGSRGTCIRPAACQGRWHS